MAFVQHRAQRAVRHHEGIAPGLADTCNRSIARRLFSRRRQPVVDICGGPHPDSGDARLHHLVADCPRLVGINDHAIAIKDLDYSSPGATGLPDKRTARNGQSFAA